MSLRQRILLAFTGCTALVALLFGVSSFLFAYHTEDRLFEALLQAEASYVQQQLDAGITAASRLAFVKYYADSTDLPDGIAAILQTAPERREFAAANGKHYHLMPVLKGWLVADVSEQLVVRSLRSQLLLFLLSLLAVVVVVAAGLAFLLARRVLKPLQKLTQVVDKAGQSPADTGAALLSSAEFAPDEIGRLAQTLQKAWCRIADFIKREQQFTQDVSHELRTPVTISQGALTLLSHTQLTVQQAQYVGRLQSAQQQISQSIETLMLLAREQLPAVQPVKLLALVEQSVLQQQHKLIGKPVELRLNIAADTILVINETALMILLNNLLGNAFEYTNAGIICIEFQQQLLTVQDSGSGIDAAIREQVFQSGVKGQNSLGMGVGLSLVKRLCDKWHIGYQLHSDASGTCISLKFPSN